MYKTVDSNIYKMARKAVDVAKLCPVNKQSSNPIPRVGVVIFKDNMLLGWYAKGFGGEYLTAEGMVRFKSKNSAHAEEALLDVLSNYDLTKAILFATLEPCTERRQGICCAERIVNSGIKNVYISNCDPNPDVGGLAWRLFHASNIQINDFPPELRNESRRDNDSFFKKFYLSNAIEGRASFDYSQDDGKRILEFNGVKITTRWTDCFENKIYALDYDNHVAIAKQCSEFSEIDDPSRWFEDHHYTKKVCSGQIVIFREGLNYALVKIGVVHTGSEKTNPELNFSYQLRFPS